jgi:hypothetical protein
MNGGTYHLRVVFTEGHQLLLMQKQMEWNETKSLGTMAPASDDRQIWSTGSMITGWEKPKCSERPAPVPLSPPDPHE